MSYYNPLLVFKFVLLTKIKKMKKLILILLFLPFISIGQDITYEDLISITNRQEFERVFIENNFEQVEKKSEVKLNYRYDIIKREKKLVASTWAYYDLEDEGKFLQYDNKLVENYNRVFDVAKKELLFLKIINGYAVYTNGYFQMGFKNGLNDDGWYSIYIMR